MLIPSSITCRINGNKAQTRVPVNLLCPQISKQQGQAMAEFFVAMLALIPLFWAVITLGKFLDFENAGRQATRYVNWEQTVNKSIADIVNNNEISNRFLRAPLGGFDASTLNSQPIVNPLWSVPAFTRPDGAYYIVNPNAAVTINRRNIAADPLTTAPASSYSLNTQVRRVTVNIPLDSLPWNFSQYPNNAALTADSSTPQVMQYAAAILPNTFIPDSEESIKAGMPSGQTQKDLDLAAATPLLAIFDGIGVVVNFFGLSTYPYAEVWDYEWLTFFDTTPDSAVLPDSRLQP